MRGRDEVEWNRSMRRDRGQAVLAVALVVAVAACAGWGIARLGAVMVQQQHARAAADAAALAAVQGGEQAARQVAAANGAELSRVTILGGDVVVEVAVGSSRAKARATRAP